MQRIEGNVGDKSGANRSALVHQAVRFIVQKALEAEAGQELRRGYYEHGDGERGYRNGYRVGKVNAAEAVIEFAVPQVSDIRPRPPASYLNQRYAKPTAPAVTSASRSRISSN